MSLNRIYQELDYVESEQVPFYMQIGACMTNVHKKTGVPFWTPEYDLYAELRREYVRGVDYQWRRWYSPSKRKVEYRLVKTQFAAPRDEDIVLGHERKLREKEIRRRVGNWQEESRDATEYVAGCLIQEGHERGNLETREGKIIRHANAIALELSQHDGYQVVAHHVADAREKLKAHVRAAKAGR